MTSAKTMVILAYMRFRRTIATNISKGDNIDYWKENQTKKKRTQNER